MKHTTAKIIKSAYYNFAKSTDTELWQVYGTFSYYKAKAMEYCKQLAQKYNAVTPCYILGHNSQTFSVGFEGMHGNRPAFFYITKDYDRFIYLDELN